MNTVQQKWNKLPEEEKRKVKDVLISYFDYERDEKIGMVAAENLLQFFISTAGAKIYNLGVKAAKTTVTNKLEETQYDLDDLFEIENE